MSSESSLRERLFKGPVSGWRAPGVHGIHAAARRHDPAFDIDGLPDPYSVYFPIFITNLYTEGIYVTALLVTPPAGWTDAEQNIAYCPTGTNVRAEKSNATRAVMGVPHNETVYLRWNYRTGGYGGPIIGSDIFAHAIYWESIAAGNVEVTDDFENPLDPGPPPTYDGWHKVDLIGTMGWTTSTTRCVHGVLGLTLDARNNYQSYIQKIHTFAAGARAYIFGFALVVEPGLHWLTFDGPVEDLDVVYMADTVWRRWGLRLTPGVANRVRIYIRHIWGANYAWSVWFDYFRWVRY